MTFLNILEVPALCGQAEPLALWAASRFLEDRLGCSQQAPRPLTVVMNLYRGCRLSVYLTVMGLRS